ncbi:MAG: GFA family protein [Cypionkella sp.]
MDLPEFPVEGGCQCGAVRYRLTGAPLAVYKCHCKDCQRFSGAGWAMSMPIAAERVERLAGDIEVYDSVSDSGRTVRMVSCAHCHTRLWNEPLSAPGLLVVRPGTLDDVSWAVSVGNIWTQSAALWAQIDPSQVNFAGQPPDRQPLYDAWTALTHKDA